MDGQVPADVVQDRYDRLVALVEEIAGQENAKLNATTVEVLVAEGEGRKDAATHRMSGRARDNRLVHFNPHATAPRPGDVVTTTVTSTAPHYLIADGEPLRVRRTRAGDAWQALLAPGGRPPGDPPHGGLRAPHTPAPSAHGRAARPLVAAPARPVLLGMPSRRG
jgi:tRNA-2-methylthio-N6-dimethylallyladenosine synthase